VAAAAQRPPSAGRQIDQCGVASEPSGEKFRDQQWIAGPVEDSLDLDAVARGRHAERMPGRHCGGRQRAAYEHQHDKDQSAAAGYHLDPGATANSVDDFVFQKTGFRPVDVRCPSGVPATAGGRFNCHFTGPEGPYTAYVRIVKVQGHRAAFQLDT
jgi:hypothetical protein